MPALPRLVDLWSFQKRFLEDRGRFVACMWARGNGKSAMSALKICLDVFDNEARGSPSDWLIVSASADQAREALRLVESWARSIYAIAAEIKIIETQVEFKTPDGLERYTRYELRLGNGTRVMAVSASPQAIRGYTCNIWWDEACFFRDDHDMWQSLQHCTRGRLKILVTSTPIGGDEKKFYQIVHDETIVRGAPLWSKHICDIYKATVEGREYDIETERAAADADAWAQEMELRWIDNKSVWFDTALLVACEDTRASTVGHGYEGGKCYLGNDIGLRGDKWAAWVAEDVSGTLVTREVVVLDRSNFSDHDREIARLFGKYNIIRMCIDQGGMGERSTEHYQDLYGASRVEGVIFNVENKGAMAVLGKELMEDRRILLPANQPEIRRDLRKLQKVVSSGGAIRFNATRDAGGHADICWALLLMLNAAITPWSPIEFTSSGESDHISELASWTD
jgi:phage FluMu gp28-like protein